MKMVDCFRRSRYGQFAVSFAVFVLAVSSVVLYWRGEYHRRAAAAVWERENSLPVRVQKMRGVRSMAADECRTGLLRQLIFGERDFEAALTVLAEVEEYGMTAELRADAVFTRGHILLYQKQDPERAMPFFQRVLHLKEGTAEQKQEAAFYLGAWHRRHGRLQDAEAMFRLVLTGPDARWKTRAAACLQEKRP